MPCTALVYEMFFRTGLEKFAVNQMRTRSKNIVYLSMTCREDENTLQIPRKVYKQLRRQHPTIFTAKSLLFQECEGAPTSTAYIVINDFNKKF